MAKAFLTILLLWATGGHLHLLAKIKIGQQQAKAHCWMFEIRSRLWKDPSHIVEIHTLA